MLKKKTIVRTALGLALAAGALPASADFVGDTVFGAVTETGSTFNGSAFTNGSALITDPGVEFTGTVKIASFIGIASEVVIFADFDGDSLTVGLTPTATGPEQHAHATSSSSLGLQFTDLDWLPLSGNITGVTLDPSSSATGDVFAFDNNWANNGPSDWTVTTTANSISILGINGFSFDKDMPRDQRLVFATFNIHTDAMSPVPVPAAGVLGSIGLGGLALVRAGRKKFFG